MEKTDNSPLVSIIMATFNEPATFIESSIDSILCQDYKHFEFLIADDSTNTETIRVIDDAAAKDDRVKVIRKPSKMGFVHALNYALSEAKGELIARMDGDDIALPDRIGRQVRFALANPSIDLFGGNIYIINQQGDIVSQRLYPNSSFSIKMMFTYRNPFAHPTIMCRRKIIDNGFFYDPEFKKAEDLELYLRLYKNGYKFRNMPDFLLRYRVVGDQQKKRTTENWVFNHKARAKNFIPSKPFFSLCSWIVSWGYQHVPSKVISYLYERENRNLS